METDKVCLSLHKCLQEFLNLWWHYIFAILKDTTFKTSPFYYL